VTITANTVLLVIDAQQGINHPDHGERNNPEAESRLALLLAAWRTDGRPVIHVQHTSTDPHSPLRSGEPGHAFMPAARPADGESVFPKTVNSAFIGTGLETHLRERGIDTLVIAGFTTDHCVSSTVRMADNLGFRVTVVSDATATHERTGPDGAHHAAEAMHRLALASLHGEFAAVRSTAEVLERLDAGGDST
jgi:nicotinamidase-related amidase